MKVLMGFFLLLFCFACNKPNSAEEKPISTNYEEMFAELKIKFNTPYKYTEIINNRATGNSGTIKFSLADTSFTEIFNSIVTKDYFRLDSFQAYTCRFLNFGRDKYPINQSLLINNARRQLSFVNGRTMISFDSISNGSYYFYQYIIKEQ